MKLRLATTIAVQRAQKSDPLVLPDRPWEKDGIGYTSGTYLRNGKNVMYYFSYLGFQCVAESADGFHWSKPELGLIEFAGSTKNNILPVDRTMGWLGMMYKDAHEKNPEAATRASDRGSSSTGGSRPA